MKQRAESRTTPEIIDSPTGEPGWGPSRASLVKIVVGVPPIGEESARIAFERFPEDLAAWYPNLTELHLWQIDGLRLKTLPPGLRCLDLRGCTGLEALPPLPATLETLDLGQCEGLKTLPVGPLPALRYLFLKGSRSLKGYALEGFFARLSADGVPVEEIDGSGTPAVTTLEEVPASGLRRLVLRDCAALVDVSRLSGFAALRHLDLTGCTGVTGLPGLPGGIEHLVLHGAETLADFMGQDIGPYGRGGKGENVARAFRTRRKFGGELAILPHAKLLLMGDGGSRSTGGWWIGSARRAVPRRIGSASCSRGSTGR